MGFNSLGTFNNGLDERKAGAGIGSTNTKLVTRWRVNSRSRRPWEDHIFAWELRGVPVSRKRGHFGQRQTAPTGTPTGRPIQVVPKFALHRMKASVPTVKRNAGSLLSPGTKGRSKSDRVKRPTGSRRTVTFVNKRSLTKETNRPASRADALTTRVPHASATAPSVNVSRL